ncbi:MAG: type IV toxin-antitoxin system AbiEi family antitoxin domain-containing protein [Acidimicrobiia bacterium]
MVGDLSTINKVAARQYGVFNTAQARRAGFDKSAVRRRKESGAWVQLAPTVYAVASAPPKWERQVAAAVLSRPKALVAGVTAAYLHKFPGVTRQKPVILVPETSNARSDLARVIRHRRFDEIRTERVDAFHVTSVEETVVLMARDIDHPSLESLFDNVLISRALSLRELDEVLLRECDSRQPGVSLVRHLAADRSPGAPIVDGSYLERLVESMFRKAGLSGWTREYPFTIRNRAARVDFYFPACLLVVEADGRSWHMRSKDFEFDRQRDNELAERGIQVVRFTYQMLDRTPDQCVTSIRKTIEARSRMVRV